jgi:hypothetical protein
MKRRIMAFASLAMLAVILVGTVSYLGLQNRAVDAITNVARPASGAASGPSSIHTGAYDKSSPHVAGPSTGEAAPAPGSAAVPDNLLPTGSSGMAEAAPTSTTAAAGASMAPAAGEQPSTSTNTGTTYQQQYQSDLTAGQVDDNAKFSDYLDYLHNNQGQGMMPDGEGVMPVDVSQRLFVRVLDNSQQPVAGARVRLFDGNRQVFEGSTMSDGRALFFPSAAGETQAAQFSAVISRGQTSVQATIKPGGPEQVVTLAALKDNSGPVGVDMVFLLDATGSMGDEIDKIKASVGSIAQRIEQLPGSSAPRFGLVAFRDRGDEFVTRSWDFTSDIQQFSTNLSGIYAGGGGDMPESVNAGLHDAIHLPGWADNSTGRHLRMIVLVGDAPPHIDYQGDYRYPDLLQEASADGIKIFPVGASDIDPTGEYVFRQFAQMTQGQFVFLTYANGVSGAPGASTDMHVSSFTVQNLDTLIVSLVAGEVANQTGQKGGSVGPQPVSMVAPVQLQEVVATAPIKTGLAAMLDDFVAGREGIFWPALLLLLLVAAVVLSTPKQIMARVTPAQSPTQFDEIYTPENSGYAGQPTWPDRGEPPDEERTMLAAHLQPASSTIEVYLDVQPTQQPTVPLG